MARRSKPALEASPLLCPGDLLSIYPSRRCEGGKGLFLGRQLMAVGGRAVDVRIAPRVQGGAGGHALRALHEVAFEDHSFACQPVQDRRAHDGVSGTAQHVGAVLVVGEEEQVPALGRRCGGRPGDGGG